MKFKAWLDLAFDTLMLEVECGMTACIREADYA